MNWVWILLETKISKLETKLHRIKKWKLKHVLTIVLAKI